MNHWTEAKAELEKIVDRFGLTNTLEYLAEICFEKSEHIQSNYNDQATARSWKSNGKILNQTSLKIKE